MKKIFSIMLIMMFLTSCQSQTKSPMLVDALVFQEKVENADVQLIDVRMPKEFKAGHLKNAKNIHLYDQDFADQIAKLDKKKPVLVYCKAGGRSAEAVEIMRNNGFETIIELDGGTDSWTEAKLPLEK